MDNIKVTHNHPGLRKYRRLQWVAKRRVGTKWEIVQHLSALGRARREMARCVGGQRL